MKKNRLNKKLVEIYVKSLMPFESPEGDVAKNTPEWLSFFDLVLKQYQRLFRQGTGDASSEPVLCFVKPFMEAARFKLSSESPRYYNALNESVVSQIETSLVKRLVCVSEHTVRKLAGVSTEESSVLSENEHQELTSFIQSIYNNPVDFFAEYNTFARVLSTLCLFWQSEIVKLMTRLSKDFEEIKELLESKGEGLEAASLVANIQSLEMSLSDPHDGGKTVVIVSFSNGDRVVYKPKSLLTEHSFSALIEWFNEHLGEILLKSLPVIEKGEYGWASYIAHQACDSEEKLQRFYVRLGMLSAVLYMLRGMDYHHENLIAHNEYPYFIDHEMLFYPVYVDPVNNLIEDTSISGIQSGYYESVLNTRLYPIVETRIDGTLGDVSAVGAYSRGEANTHLPFIDSCNVDYYQYRDCMINGFSEVYRTIMQYRDELLKPGGAIDVFSTSKLRFNVRSTSTYLSINRSCMVPEALRSGVDFCNRINVLRVNFPPIFSQGLPPEMRLEELKMLCNLDVPKFDILATDTALRSRDGRTLEKIFMHSGKALVEQRIRDMSEAELARQVGFIQDALRQGDDYRRTA